MKTSKPLNLDENQRIGCTITFNVNRYEVRAASGFFMTAAADKASLDEQIKTNRLSCEFDAIATRMYKAGR